MGKNKYVHLRMHSEYSVNNSTIRLSDVVRSAAIDDQSALGLTDLGNTFAYIKFYRLARESGIKPILGIELRLRMDSKAVENPRIILLCKNQLGYKKLCRIVSRGWLDYSQLWQQGAVSLDWFLEDDPLLGGRMSDDLICLSGGIFGELGLNSLKTEVSEKEILDKTKEYLKIFGDNFYLETQKAGFLHEDIFFQKTFYIADKLSIPIVATHPIQFLEKAGFSAHQARVAISEGETLTSLKTSTNYSSEQYFLSQDEMVMRFKDFPGALENTLEIVKRCNLEFEFGSVQLPRFSIGGSASMPDYLKEKAFEGLKQKLT
ncbi:MAG: PHP domain-containing protein, partial [Burkholderiaceae bacterium]